MASPLKRGRAASDQDSCEQVAKPVKCRRVGFEVLQPRWGAHVPLNADLNRLIGSFMLPREDEVKANFKATMAELEWCMENEEGFWDPCRGYQEPPSPIRTRSYVRRINEVRRYINEALECSDSD
jgi:hypothetical protein